MLSKGRRSAPAMPRTILLLALLACTDPTPGAFKMPRDPENLRARLLPRLEGHPIDEARTFLRDQGFSCDPPLPSAAEAHAHLCHAAAQDAAWTRWSVVLLDRSGRVADVQVR